MITAYFWKDGQVVSYSNFTGTPEIRRAGLSGLYCVDVTTLTPEMRYGKYTIDGWSYIPLKDFPKEFLAMLMIMGVPYG